MVIFWRRTDVEGLERLELVERASGVRRCLPSSVPRTVASTWITPGS